MILSADQSEVIFAGSGANSLPINTPAYVISAQNPYEQFLGADENKRRTKILGEFLKVNPSVTALARVLGRSADPDATWAEESWAVSGLKRAEALEIGSIFQQRAIFELTDNEIITIAIDGTVMHVNSRCLA
jgi:PAS domain-containing protein